MPFASDQQFSCFSDVLPLGVLQMCAVVLDNSIEISNVTIYLITVVFHS